MQDATPPPEPAGPRVSRMAADALSPGVATPGIVREVAFDTGRASLMRTRAEGNAASGWHHHGERDILGYVVRGRAQFEFGPGGREKAEIAEGEFFHIPARLVHRDLNPLDEAQELVINIVGDGPLVVNVEGPDPA